MEKSHYEIKIQDEPSSSWNSLAIKSAKSSFINSYEWIDFQKSLGKNIEKCIIFHNKIPVGNFYIEIYRRKIAKFAYVPHGPIFLSDSHWNNDFINIFKKFALNYISKNKLNYFKFEPLILNNENKLKELLNSNSDKCFSPGQARIMWQLDIPENIESLLGKFKKKDRYYAKKTLSSNLKFVEVESLGELDKSIKLLEDTRNRKMFRNFDNTYFVKQFNFLKESGIVKIFNVELEGEILATALFNIFNNVVYYSHGGSTSNSNLKKHNASFFLQLKMIQYGLKNNLKIHNFWGVYPENFHDKSKLGINRFKKQFPGYSLEYIGTREFHKNTLGFIINKVFDYIIYYNDRY